MVHKCNNLVRCANDCGDVAKDVRNHAEGEDKHGEVKKEGCEITN